MNTAFYSIHTCWRPAVAAIAALLLAACAERRAGQPIAGAADSDWAAARDVTLVLADYRFIPAELIFERGGRYRLRLDNRGTELHEFTAPDFLAAVALRDPTVLAAGKNEIVVAPRTAKVLYFTARQPGRYELTCADHDWAGMVGTIVIE